MPYPVLPPDASPPAEIVYVDHGSETQSATLDWTDGLVRHPAEHQIKHRTPTQTVVVSPPGVWTDLAVAFTPVDPVGGQHSGGDLNGAQPELQTSSSFARDLGSPVEIKTTGFAVSEIDRPHPPSGIDPVGESPALTTSSLSEESRHAQVMAPEMTSPSLPASTSIPTVIPVDETRLGTDEPEGDDSSLGSEEAIPPADVTTLNLQADEQEYNPITQVITARGNVVMRAGDAILDADRLWVNLTNRYVVAEGRVSVRRGDQAFRGQRVEYNLVQDAGILYGASGEVFLPTLETDFSRPLPTDAVAQANRPVSDRILANQPLEEVTNTGGLVGGTDAARNPYTNSTGGVRQFRFEANQIEFNADGWWAENVRLTNDPFSPPELEFRADTARLVQISEEQDELQVSNPRIVFDQGFSLPLFRSRILLNRGTVDTDDLNPLPTGIGIDAEHGGLYLERQFRLYDSGPWQVIVTPQFNAARFFGPADIDPGDLSVYGLVAQLNGQPTPRTTVQARASLPRLDVANASSLLRASVRVQQLIGTHQLALEYSYRDRLYNGTLGFQDVQSNLGLVLQSPSITLGDTGLVLSYQAGVQYITAETDRANLISPSATNNLISLVRSQGSVSLSRGFQLWRGEGLPATATEGLKYSPTPVVPYLALTTGLRATGTYYSSGDFQNSVTGVIGLEGQFGHFSRPFLDYTRFNISYSQDLTGGALSPFKFDRSVDQRVLSAGIIQQIYGPFRVGFQTSVNLDNARSVNTDYILEYSRRTYGIVLSYNPTQSTGFIGFRLSDFTWIGRPQAFDQREIRQVEGGVIQ